MKVKDLMSTEALQSCSLETKLRNAAKIMKDTNHGALPVLDKTNKVIGMVTDRDICLSLASKSEKPLDELTVKNAISTLKVHSVKPEDTLTSALQEMRKNKIGRLPVVDKEGKLTGILSLNKILSHSIEKKEELGHLTSKEENLAKTITAIVDRNSKQTKKVSEALEA